MATVEVKGLRECLRNMAALGELVTTKITREALREQAWVIARAIRAATYKNFVKRTGAIRSGVGVIVQKDPKDQKLKAFATEYPQSIAGAATPFALVARKRLSRKRRRAVPTFYVAVWWRWLEFGTGPRRAASTPKWLNKSPTRSAKVATKRAQRLAAFQASPSRGAIKARNWMRPAFASSAEAGIATFRQTVFDEIERETNAMTK